MRDFDDGIRSTIAETRMRVAETAFNHVTTAVGLFESYAYSQATFLAMTAIEEIGKARTLQMIQADIYSDREPQEIDVTGVQNFLNKHNLKALRAAVSGLSVNHGAVRRHGRHEEADINLPTGIQFLAESEKWMEVRNSSIYTDVNIEGKSVSWPTMEVSAHHAYYFITMAFEILAKEAEAGFGNPIENLEQKEKITDFETAAEYRSSMISLLKSFMEKYQAQFEPEELQFFVEDPRLDDLRSKLRQREINLEESERDEIRDLITEFVEEPEEKPSDLPETFDVESYQDEIIEDMIDMSMDLPYFTSKELHPDLEELSEHIKKYVKYS